MTTTTPAEAAPGKPDWCGTYKSTSDEKAKWVSVTRDVWAVKNRNYMALGGCDKPDDPKRQELVEKWRQQYAKDFAGTPKDFSEMLAVYINTAETEKQHEQACTAVNSITDISKLHLLKEELDCKADAFGGGPKKKDGWDDKPTSSVLYSALVVQKCLWGISMEADRVSSQDVLKAIPCYTDIQNLDRARLDQELNTPQFNPWAKAMIREAFGIAKLKSDLVAAKSKEAIASNANMKKVLVDGPEAGLKAWRDAYASHKEALDAASDLADKFDRDPNSIKGCSAKMRGFMSSYVAEKKPNTLEAVRTVLTDDVGFPISRALMRCEAADGHPQTSVMLYESIIRHAKKAHEGPRAAANDGAVQALGTLPEDMASNLGHYLHSPTPHVAIPPSANNKVFLAKGGLRAKMEAEELEGEIASLAPNKDGTLVTFKKVTRKDYEEKCADVVPHRLDYISDDGHVYWKQNCWKTGKFETITLSEAPFVAPSGYEGSLAVGQTLVFMAENSGTPRVGLPIRTYGDKDKNKIAGFLQMKIDGVSSGPATKPGNAVADNDEKPAKKGGGAKKPKKKRQKLASR
jgi:hypothetical protein